MSRSGYQGKDITFIFFGRFISCKGDCTFCPPCVSTLYPASIPNIITVNGVLQNNICHDKQKSGAPSQSINKTGACQFRFLFCKAKHKPHGIVLFCVFHSAVNRFHLRTHSTQSILPKNATTNQLTTVAPQPNFSDKTAIPKPEIPLPIYVKVLSRPETVDILPYLSK